LDYVRETSFLMRVPDLVVTHLKQLAKEHADALLRKR
jgi:hypothetical protein